jgi:SEC-C motif-containing protein
MELMSMFGRNDPCPCGSGLKYKKFCLDKRPWDEILREPFSQQIRHLSLRGKNQLFLGTILDALQIDKATGHTVKSLDFVLPGTQRLRLNLLNN